MSELKQNNNRKATRSVFAVGLFTGAYMLAAAVATAIAGNTEFIFYVVVMLILLGAVYLLHRQVNLTHGALWALSVWGLLHMAGGLVPVPESLPINGDIRVLYSLWFIPGYLKYDHLVHAYGFGVTTWVCWQGLVAAGANRGIQLRPTAGLMVLVAAAGLGFGAMNEVVEFAATLLIPETNVGGYINTGWDLVANLVGVTVAVILIYCFNNKNIKHRGTEE